jgi:mycothiol synthase
VTEAPRPVLPEGLTTRPLTTADAAAVFELVAAQERADVGRVEIEEADLVGDWQRPSYDLAARSVVVLDGERVVAYAELPYADRAETAVHPDHRGRGIGTWLAAWTQETARAAGQTVIGSPMPEGSAGDRLMRDLGYTRRWTSWVLQLPAGATIADRPLPEGYAVGAAEPSAYVAAHDVLEDAFLEWSVREREPYDDFVARTVERPGFEPWHLRVVTDPVGAVVAVAFLIVSDGDAWIDRLATRADQRGRGLAQALMVDAFAVARAHGATTSGLSTDSRTGALGLYEKVGMRVVDTWVNRAVGLLPAGLTTRPLGLDDAPAVHGLVAAEERRDLGRVTIEVDDIVGEWQSEGRDLAATTIGVEDDGVLVAYGELDGAHAFAAVHPDHQGRGTGRWVAQWLETAARRAGLDALGGQVLADAAGDRLLRARGYAENFTAWDLELPAGVEITGRDLPSSYALRVAGPDDHEACWTLFEDAFLEWSDRERRPLEEFGSAMWGRPGFEPWNLRVVNDAGGAVVGACFVTLTDGDAYVHKVAVRRDRRGLGLATVLLADAFAAAREHGAAVSRLSTDTRAGARTLYENLGMVVESTWVNRSLRLDQRG